MQNIYETVVGQADTAMDFPKILIRDVLLTNILGDDSDSITYWAGKQLARQFPIGSPTDLTVFFEQAGFGELELVKSGNHRQVWRLSGPSIETRISHVEQPDFMLEAGFLAESIQQQTGDLTEAQLSLEQKHRSKAVDIELVSDPHDVDENYDTPTFMPVKKATIFTEDADGDVTEVTSSSDSEN
ncbi:YslB family protein [Levilactobacillus bambusae]|uniref:DUF2507 domain-containing protein n=1 Tax=Levilactobacillus bambusae TaxID=2024736 RepID=A0A2V1MXS7_9LACO|nr:YslB family protein [Levilactobacillus bambusae]PWF99592.1 DUF2507 domain-containing protein [Levilactobacillus bambusae]